MLKAPTLLLGLSTTISAAEVKVGEAVDYSKLAFYPDRWEKQGFDTQLYLGPENTVPSPPDFPSSYATSTLIQLWKSLPAKRNTPEAPNKNHSP